MALIKATVASSEKISNLESKDLGNYKHKLTINKMVSKGGVTVPVRATFTLITLEPTIGTKDEQGVTTWEFESTQWKPEVRTFQTEEGSITYTKLIPRD